MCAIGFILHSPVLWQCIALHHTFTHFFISFRVGWGKACQPVYIAVKHAEGSGYQNGIVHFFIGSAFRAGGVNIFGFTSLPSICTLPAIC
jgi:hypothetical protein